MVEVLALLRNRVQICTSGNKSSYPYLFLSISHNRSQTLLSGCSRYVMEAYETHSFLNLRLFASEQNLRNHFHYPCVCNYQMALVVPH